MYASSLWTLQHLCFGPDVAADYSDREENRDPGQQQKKPLTKETRLENGPPWQALFWRFERIGSGAVMLEWTAPLPLVAD